MPHHHPIIFLCSEYFKVPIHDICTSMGSQAIRARMIAVMLFRDETDLGGEEVAKLMPVISGACGDGGYQNILHNAMSMIADTQATSGNFPNKDKFTADFYHIKFDLMRSKDKRPKTLSKNREES